ncbi:hypothetical protein [Streptosporangium vulgare]
MSVATIVSLPKGALPVAVKTMVEPQANTSAGKPTCSPAICSGAM